MQDPKRHEDADYYNTQDGQDDRDHTENATHIGICFLLDTSPQRTRPAVAIVAVG